MNITMVERYVIESMILSKKEVFSVVDLLDLTGLNLDILTNVKKLLVTKNLFLSNGDEIRLNIELIKSMAKDDQSKNGEVLELMESLLITNSLESKKADSMFRMKKIFLDKKSEKIFKAMVQNLEEFIVDCNKNIQKDSLKDSTVVFLGMSKYKNLLSQFVSSV